MLYTFRLFLIWYYLNNRILYHIVDFDNPRKHVDIQYIALESLHIQRPNVFVSKIRSKVECKLTFSCSESFGLKKVWMGPLLRALSASGVAAAEGDSWCSGCIAVEGCTTALKGFWWSSSHRRLLKASWCRQVSNFGRWKIWTPPYKPEWQLGI